jgi:predicted Zn-dependent protease
MFRLTWPKSIIASILICGAVVFGFWQYALYQWNAAKTDLAEDRVPSARSRLAFCTRVWPKSTDVHLLAARADRRIGDLPSAESHLNRCLELQGGSTEAIQLEFLLMRVQSGEVDTLAQPLFESVQQGNPEYAAILETIALTYIKRLRYRPAAVCLSIWAERQPDLPKIYHWRGWVFERMNNSKAAMADYQKVIELNPDHFAARLRLAEMLLEDKQAPEATPHLERLYQKHPNDPHVLARLGACRFLEGRVAEARKFMEAAVVHLPDDPVLLCGLANLEMQENHPKEAERYLRTVLASDPSDTEALFILSSVLQAQERTDEAAVVLAEYEKKRQTVDRINDLLKDVADSPKATASDYAEIGELFLSIGREKHGVYWLEHALTLNPNHPGANRALAVHNERKTQEGGSGSNRVKSTPSPTSPFPPSVGTLGK